MKKEYVLATIIGLIVLVLSNIYLIFGMIQPKPGLVFLGRHVINSQDMYTYVSFIEQARQGRIFFENLYSTEPQTVSLVRPSYVVIGGMASVFQISSVTAYHIGRLILSASFLIVMYIFIKQFFRVPASRLFCFLVVFTSSGVGFAVGGLWSNSSDLWIPESNTFLSLQEAPHVILSQILMLIAFMALLKGWNTQKVKYFIFTFLALVLLGFEHPYNLFTCSAVVVFTAVGLWVTSKIPKKLLIWGVVAVIAASGLALLYQYAETLRNPILNSWKFDSISPSPLDYVLGFGFISIFALFGIEKYLSERKPGQLLVLSWVFASIILLYSPVYFQRRLSEGINIPLSILAAQGIITVAFLSSAYVLERTRKIVYITAIYLFIGILSIGSIVSVVNDTRTILSDNLFSYYYYMLNGEIASMNWIKKNSTTHDVILSNWFYGNVLPGISGRKVFIGHKAQTQDFDKKIEVINKFLLNNSTEESYKFLEDNNIKFIFVGNNDSMVRYGFKPEKKPYLVKVFESVDGARVYKVKQL